MAFGITCLHNVNIGHMHAVQLAPTVIIKSSLLSNGALKGLFSFISDLAGPTLGLSFRWAGREDVTSVLYTMPVHDVRTVISHGLGFI